MRLFLLIIIFCFLSTQGWSAGNVFPLSLAGRDAGVLTYTPSTGLPVSLQTYLNQFVFAELYGLTCDGGLGANEVTTNTAALNQAIATAVNLKRKTVVIPSGTCVLKPINVSDKVNLEGQGQGQTILLRGVDDNTTTTFINLNNFSGLHNLTVDGNKANHTVGAFGVGGYRAQGARIEDVTIQNTLGMGDAFSDSARILHIRETVTGTQRPSSLTGTTGSGNGSGFWSASYTQSSYYYDGGSQYIDCVSHDNDLDGIEYGSNNITIRGGSYYNNGQFTDKSPSDQSAGTHSAQLGGALGAAGIYFAPGQGGAGSPPQIGLNATIENVLAYGNSESGFDVGLGGGSVVTNNVAHHNGTFGFLLDGYATAGSLAGSYLGAGSYTLTGNHAYDNGQSTNATWIAGNPTIMTRTGFTWTGQQSGATITGNKSYDDQGSPTQLWGVYGMVAYTAVGTVAFDNFMLGNNQFSGPSGASNFDGISGTVPANFTHLTNNDQHAYNVWSPTISVDAPGGTPPTFSMVSARYSQRPDKTVSLAVTFKETTVGTGTGCITFTLPTTPVSNSTPAGRETTNSKSLSVAVTAGSTLVRACLADGTSPQIANDFYNISGFYESQ